MRRILTLLLVPVGLMALVASCASDDTSEAAVPDLSDVTMTDVVSGQDATLGGALDAPASTPVLAWFWAPH